MCRAGQRRGQCSAYEHRLAGRSQRIRQRFGGGGATDTPEGAGSGAPHIDILVSQERNQTRCRIRVCEIP
jgi:hypothetical protein